MKRYISLLFVLLMLFVVGCGEKKADSRVVDGSFEFTAENYPKICVTPYTLDTAINITCAVLGIDQAEALGFIEVCDSTDECHIKLVNGKCDMIIAHPRGSVADEALSSSAMQFNIYEIDRDALVFISNGFSGVMELTTEQIRSLYIAETTDWQNLGGQKCAVTLFDCKKGTAASAAFERYIDKDISVPAVTRPLLSGEDSFEGEVGYDNRNGAIGYTLFSQTVLNPDTSVKLISVNGVEPTRESVRNGHYPFTVGVNIYTRISETADSGTYILYQWLKSEQGNAVVSKIY